MKHTQIFTLFCVGSPWGTVVSLDLIVLSTSHYLQMFLGEDLKLSFIIFLFVPSCQKWWHVKHPTCGSIYLSCFTFILFSNVGGSIYYILWSWPLYRSVSFFLLLPPAVCLRGVGMFSTTVRLDLVVLYAFMRYCSVRSKVFIFSASIDLHPDVLLLLSR